jgi:hypothetical protein
LTRIETKANKILKTLPNVEGFGQVIGCGKGDGDVMLLAITPTI